MSFLHEYLLQNKKCQLRCQTDIDHHLLYSYAVDCNFHEHVWKDMVRNMIELLAEKVEFRSEENLYKNCTTVRGEVYVFLPVELVELSRAIDSRSQTIDQGLTKKFLEMGAEIINLKEELAQLKGITKKEKTG